MKKSNAANKLEITEFMASYDEQAKKLLTEKVFLAEILIQVVPEFAGMNRKEVEELIEAPILNVSAVPGETNISSSIWGLNTEDFVPNEGKIIFDICFVAHAPSGDQLIKLYVNVEIQKKYHVGYDLVTRGFFYAARMLSAEFGKEFEDPNYNDIKKVYSIWLCMDSPKYAQNTTTRYHIVPENLVGNFPKDKARFDLLEVIMICLPKEIAKVEDNRPLHRLLGVTLSNKLSALEKEQILQHEFCIPITKTIDRRVKSMCNLSEAIVEEDMIKLIKICKEFGISAADVENQLVEQYSLSKEDAADFVKRNW